MPSTVLLFGLLILYTIISGRMTWALDNLNSLFDAIGIFKSEKIAKGKKDYKPNDSDGTGDLPPGEGNIA